MNAVRYAANTLGWVGDPRGSNQTISVWVPEGRKLGVSTLKDPLAAYDLVAALPSIRQPEWLRLTRHRIGVVLRLAPGWNGCGSRGIDRVLAFKAERVLEAAMKACKSPIAPFVVPCSDGSFQFEWRTANTRFEFYFETDGAISAWAQNRESGYEVEAEGRDAVELLRKWSSRLAEKGAKLRSASLPEEIST